MENQNPPEALLQMVTGHYVARGIYVAAKLKLADHIARGVTESEELARATKTDATSLYRLLRALASIGIFEEQANKRFALTPMAESLRSNVPGSLNAFAIMVGEEHHWNGWEGLRYSVETGKSSFEHLYGEQFFPWLTKRPEYAVNFDEAMTSHSALENEHLVAACDFSGIGTLVDVAGGHGTTLAAILRANPAMKGILFDMPHVIETARERLKDSDLENRIELVAGDFFVNVPEGANAYFMKHIIHDWGDEECIKILANCRRAMSQGGRVLIAEIVLPPGNEPSPGKWLDLTMLVMTHGGRERTESEYRNLLARAGFKLSRVVQTEGAIGLVEGRPAD
jgi:ubiquinone/menaquinone biosynthesis C-methylase UbiE